MVSVCLCTGSTSAESVGQGEEGGVTDTLLCTWWQLGLSVKRSWLRSGGPILGFKKTRASFGGVGGGEKEGSHLPLPESCPPWNL